jgi:hypothetical protein
MPVASIAAKQAVAIADYRRDATERKEGDVHLPEDERYSLRVPCFAAQADKFAALISDESANENWAKNTILICHDFEWDGDNHTADIGDFLVRIRPNKRYGNLSSVHCSAIDRSRGHSVSNVTLS